MKNAETSSEAPATLTSVKPASMKLVGKCVAQSHTSPSLWYSATCWRGNSWPLLGVEMMGSYFQCCEFFWWQSGAAALGTGFCLPVSEHRWNPQQTEVNTADRGQYSLAISPLVGKRRIEHVPTILAFRGGVQGHGCCPACLGALEYETWHILDAWELLRTKK